MTLTLQLPSEIWNEDLLVSPSTNQLCMNLQSNVCFIVFFHFYSYHSVSIRKEMLRKDEGDEKCRIFGEVKGE